MTPTAFSGWHRRAGFFAARGSAIVPGDAPDYELPDVPALALHLLDEAIPRRYAQEVPRNLFSADWLAEHPPRSAGRPEDGLRRPGSFEAYIDPEVEAQLQSLGYVQ